MAAARQLKRKHRRITEICQQRVRRRAAKAVLEIQREFDEGDAAYKAWWARYTPARKRLEQQLDDLEKRGEAKIWRELGTSPNVRDTQKKRIKSLGKKFPRINWTAVLVEQ